MPERGRTDLPRVPLAVTRGFARLGEALRRLKVGAASPSPRACDPRPGTGEPAAAGGAGRRAPGRRAGGRAGRAAADDPPGAAGHDRGHRGPAQINRQRVVADARQAVERDVELPPGWSLAWGGQFENLRQATERLAFLVPLVLLLIFVCCL